jgi:hypothetical protein
VLGKRLINITVLFYSFFSTSLIRQILSVPVTFSRRMMLKLTRQTQQQRINRRIRFQAIHSAQAIHSPHQAQRQRRAPLQKIRLVHQSQPLNHPVITRLVPIHSPLRQTHRVVTLSPQALYQEMTLFRRPHPQQVMTHSHPVEVATQ